MIKILFCIFFTITTVTSECGYNACHKTDPKRLSIHVIPHSHDDVGWLNTPDGYYTTAVKAIITNVVKCLNDNPSRRFTQVEQYFFHRWWTEQNDASKNSVRKLVSDGRLVFTNGGWTVNDEGAAHYNNIIDQLTLGLKFLNDEFGKCGHPRTSWQIDPFGASKEMASLYAQFGYDGHVLNRGPHPKGEFVWRGSKDLDTKILSTVLHNHYSAPNGFSFENGNDITDANKQQKADQFVNNAKNWNKDYGNTNNVLVTMGDDFTYHNAERWFSNIDKLIKEVQAVHKDVDIFYSTPNCYINSLNQVGKTFGVREEDYLNYWVGYYSNRPELKKQDRLANNYLQAAKQMDVISRIDPGQTKGDLDEARNEVAIMTHHDAITGTSPQKMIDDYASRLTKSLSSSSTVIDKVHKHLLSKGDTTGQTFCTQLSFDDCGITESDDRVAITVYNPVARPVSDYIRIPVPNGNFDVFDSKGAKVGNKNVVPISKDVTSIPGRRSRATNEVVFRADLPALGFNTYFLKKTGALIKRSTEKIRQKRATYDLKGKSFTAQVDTTSGTLYSITTGGKTHMVKQSFKYYKPEAGVKGREDSGSYHFCPDGTAHDFGAPKLQSHFTSGSNHEVHQYINEYISQTIRTYDDEDYIEFEWTVGPIPMGDNIGKEIITKFESDLKNDRKFFTDANGRQMVERTYNPGQTSCGSSVSGNWYPIYSKAFIRDTKSGMQMSVLNDRTQGGSSLNDGSIELMVQRRLNREGSGGPFKVDEHGYVRGKHYLFLKPISESAKPIHDLAQKLLLAPVMTFQKYTSTEADFISKHVTSYSGVNKALPDNLNLLTLENWKKGQILLRLENVYQNSDNSPLAKGVDFDIKDFFKTFKVGTIEETTLGANELLGESHRLSWKSSKFFSLNETEPLKRSARAVGSNIHLNPQQIRTFIINVS